MLEKQLREQQERMKAEQMNCRAAVVVPQIINEEERSVRTVLATETPSLVFDWERWEIVREVLMISERSVDLPENAQLPLIDSHWRGSVENLKGSLRQLTVENNELVARTFFSSLAENEWTQVREGHLTDVSVGYTTYPEHTVIIPPQQKAMIEGREFINDQDSTLLVRTKWTPKEGSLVVVGADENANFRSAEQSQNKTRKDEEINSIKKDFEEKLENQKREMDEKIKSITFKGEPKMDDNKKTVEDAKVAERQRIIDIEAYGKRFAGKFSDSENTTATAIREGWDVNKFRTHVIDNLDGNAAVETPKSEIGMSRSEVKSFSITRAMLAAATGDWSKAGLEREALETTEKAIGRTASERGFFIPREVQLSGARALSTGVAADGGNLVGEDFRGQDYIEMLRSKTVLGQAGITVLSGLSEDIAIPSQTGDPTISMVAEGSAPAATALTFGQKTASPNTATANVAFTRKLMLQGNPSVDKLVIDSLYSQLNIKKDYMGLFGSGAAPEPEGIANTTGIGTVTMAGVPNWANIVEFETDVEAADANIGTASWITNATVKGLLKTTLKATNTGIFLMDESGSLNGYPSYISSLVTAKYLFYGFWQQLVLAEWGNTEIIVDPYSDAASAIINTTIVDEFDYVVRHAASFSMATDATP